MDGKQTKKIPAMFAICKEYAGDNICPVCFAVKLCEALVTHADNDKAQILQVGYNVDHVGHLSMLTLANLPGFADI